MKGKRRFRISPRWRDLRVGDIMMGYGYMRLLVKRIPKKEYVSKYGNEKRYWHEGLFLDLYTGATNVIKLTGAKLSGDVVYNNLEVKK